MAKGAWLRVALLLASVTASACGGGGSGGGHSSPANAIQRENQQRGSGRWQLEAAGLVPADDARGQIKGYASATSVNRGEAIAFHVSVNPAQPFTIEVYRIGWYRGAGGRFMTKLGPLPGMRQPDCPIDPVTGLIACAWATAATLTVPETWTSGVYLAVLATAAGEGNYVVFVVRDDESSAPLRYQQSVTTYQAYNRYPNDGVTGKDLYPESYGPPTVAGDTRAVKVSFDRPYDDTGAGQFLRWEIDFVRWLERVGYDVTYSTDLDTHERGDRLLAARGFLSVGHDEYWSLEMRQSIEGARDAGTSLGFFGANEGYWQVRFEPSALGVSNRVMVCYKDAALDPDQGERTTVKFRDLPVGRPEQPLVGVQYGDIIAGGITGQYATYTVSASRHWVFAGTGLHDGDAIAGIVGYETDHVSDDAPLPSARPDGPQTLLFDASFTDFPGGEGHASASIYRAPSGAWVFAAGTIGWSLALDELGDRAAPNAGIQHVTANVLARFLEP